MDSDSAVSLAARDAGDTCAWALTDVTTHFRSAERLRAHGLTLSKLAAHRDAALADPAAFVSAYFAAIDTALQDVSYDMRNDYSEFFRAARAARLKESDS